MHNRWPKAFPTLITKYVLRLPLVFLQILIALLLLAPIATAQDAERTARVPGTPAGSYNLGDDDAINLFTGNLNYYLPLYTSGGRGEVQAKLAVVFENQWDRIEIPAQGWPEGYLEHRYSNRYPDPLAFVGSVRFHVSTTETDEPCDTQTDRYVVYRTNMVYVEPSGTEHLLRDRTFHGLPHNECVVGQNLGRIFESSAGDFVTFINDANIFTHCYPAGVCTNFNSVDGYLYFRNGTKSRVVGGNIIWMQDRNGNRIDYQYEVNPHDLNAKRLTKITDSVGRDINIAYDVNEPEPFGRCTKITFKGVGGQDKVIRISRDGDLSHLLRTTQSYDSTTPADIGDIEHDDPNDSIILTGGASGSPDYVKAVWLPDGRGYQFKYNVLGQLARVDLPTGGAIEYDFADIFQIPFQPIPDPLGPSTNAVSEKRVYDTNNVLVGKTRFSNPASYTQGVIPTSRGGTVRDVEVFAPSGNRLSKSRHYFFGRPDTQWPLIVPWWHGREFRTEAFDFNGTTLLSVAENDWRERTPSWCSSYPPCSFNPLEEAPVNNPFLVETKLTVVDGNLVSKVTSADPTNGSWAFDDYNNQTDVWQYGYGIGQPGALISHAQTSYINGANAQGGLYLLGLPATKSVYAVDSSGQPTLAAATQMLYDEYSQYPLLTYDSVTQWQDPGGVRGNPTSVRHWLSSTNMWIETHAQYDQSGNVRSSWDARGNQSQVEYSSAYQYAFPTTTTTAVPDPNGIYGSNVAFTSTTNYDFNSGHTLSTTDANNITSSAEYNDTLNRPTRSVRATGNVAQSQSPIIYDDANHLITGKSDLSAFNDSRLKSETVYDGLGRTIETRQYEGGTNYTAVRTEYDAMGRPYKVSNPFRPWENETPVWTTSSFDALGRVILVTTPDGAQMKTAYAASTSGTLGMTILVKDQSGKQRISKTNALGQLTDVWEITPNDSAIYPGIQAVTFPDHSEVTAGYHTSYSYDVLGNLLTVNQGSQTRTFVYDSLSRLFSATNPESGTISYQYDDNGNLTQKTDARGVAAHYSYDALNRATRRWYNSSSSLTAETNNSPALPSGLGACAEVIYTYDSTSVANAKGRLVSVSSSVSSYTYSGYDALGRALGATQTIGAQSYSVAYTYDLAGQVLSETYPSGHTVRYNYDDAGRLADKVPGSQTPADLAFSGNLGDGMTRTYTSGLSYDAASRMLQEGFGTANPLYHKQHYNIRGQLYDVRLSSLPGNEWDWNRGAIVSYYSSNHVVGGSGADNNGNLLRSETFIPNDEQINSYNFIRQDYTYDSLNRLTAVAESANGTAPSFAQSYSYDRWGNRSINTQNSATWGAGINSIQSAIDPGSNRLYAQNDTSHTLVDYDAAGNQTKDYLTGNGTRAYDAENRMISATDSANHTSTYSYDGDGRRVKRNVSGLETWQVYGLGGELLGEYAVNGAPSAPQKEYGYRNGQLLVTAEVTAGAPPPPSDTVWFDDATPNGAVLYGSGESWNWVGSNPAPYSAALEHQSALVAGFHNHYFMSATQTLSVGTGDKLFAYAYLDPANPPPAK